MWIVWEFELYLEAICSAELFPQLIFRVLLYLFFWFCCRIKEWMEFTLMCGNIVEISKFASSLDSSHYQLHCGSTVSRTNMSWCGSYLIKWHSTLLIATKYECKYKLILKTSSSCLLSRNGRKKKRSPIELTQACWDNRVLILSRNRSYSSTITTPYTIIDGFIVYWEDNFDFIYCLLPIVPIKRFLFKKQLQAECINTRAVFKIGAHFLIELCLDYWISHILVCLLRLTSRTSCEVAAWDAMLDAGCNVGKCSFFTWICWIQC